MHRRPGGCVCSRRRRLRARKCGWRSRCPAGRGLAGPHPESLKLAAGRAHARRQAATASVLDCLVEGVPTYGQTPCVGGCYQRDLPYLPSSLPYRHLFTWRSIWHRLLPCSEGHLRSSPSWQKAGDHFLDNLDPRGQNHVHVLLFAQSNSAGAEDSDRMVGMAGCLVPPLEALMKCVHMVRLLAAAAASAAIQEAAECTVAGSCEHVRDLEQVCLKTVESRAACLQLGMP